MMDDVPPTAPTTPPEARRTAGGAGSYDTSGVLRQRRADRSPSAPPSHSRGVSRLRHPLEQDRLHCDGVKHRRVASASWHRRWPSLFVPASAAAPGGWSGPYGQESALTRFFSPWAAMDPGSANANDVRAISARQTC